MYTEFYGFKEKPFKLTPDPDFFYLSSVHRQALAYLTYGLEDKQGFIAITGEVGSGKTTVIQVLLNNLKDTTKVAKINNTKVTSLQLLEMIVQDFGLKVQGGSKTELLESLNQFLLEQHALGNYALLIVDEAQNLSPSLLEEIRLLSNLETNKEKLLQIILAGQPELAYKLQLPQLRQLSQRITVNFHMTGLDKKETEGYIGYRLQVAGHQNNGLFTPGAIERIAEVSGGIPRLINIICDYALLTGYVKEARQIDEGMVMEAIQELKVAQDTPVEGKKEISGCGTQQVGLSNPQLEKKLDELGHKLEWICKILSKIEQMTEVSLGRDEVSHASGEVLPPKATPIEGRFKSPLFSKILREFITNSAHFPLFVALLKINMVGFSWYIQDITHLALWVGGFLQTWFLVGMQPVTLPLRLALIKLLGNFVLPLVYSSIGLILEGLTFVQRSEFLALWGYSLIIGSLQAIQVWATNRGRNIVNLLEVMVRMALIPVLYIFYELEKEGKVITSRTLEEFFIGLFNNPPEVNLTKTLNSPQEFVVELFKNPFQAYLIEAFLFLGVLYGLNQILKIKNRV